MRDATLLRISGFSWLIALALVASPALRISGFSWLIALALVASPALQAKPDQAKSMAANKHVAELVAAGKRLYLEGRGVSGVVIKATVQGDVPVNGDQVTCQSCHGRSGMGTIESGTIPPGITGPLLFAPDIRTRTQRQRPAYSEKTLARAIRKGVDANGKPLNPLMPRFQLSDADLAALTVYLRQLGSALSPGSTEDDLRIATVIAGDVDPSLAQAHLDVIQTFVAARNRGAPQRLRGGHFPHDIRETFREWSLDVWRLSGAPDTWRAQIDKLYQKQPAFALIGGLAAGSWQPIHEFCETQEVPCLFPDVDVPPDDVNGYYSFYYSRGLLLEADIIASTIKAKNLGANIVSIMDSGNSRSLAAANAMERTLKKTGMPVKTLDIRNTPNLSLASVADNHASVIVAWLNADNINQLAKGSQSAGPPLFMSAILLGANGDKLPAALKSRTHVVQLTALSTDPDPALRRFRAWAQVQKVKLRDDKHQVLTYYACMAFAEGVKHTGLYLSREYVLDLLNHSSKLSAYLPLYTRGGITPWQRVLSRGGYLIDLSGRAKPAWILP